jgi:hypothetical protein
VWMAVRRDGTQENYVRTERDARGIKDLGGGVKGWLSLWMGEWVGGLMDGRMDGWVGGCVDGWTDGVTEYKNY